MEGGGSVDYIPRKYEVAAYNTITGVRNIDNRVTIDPFIEIILLKGGCIDSISIVILLLLKNLRYIVS